MASRLSAAAGTTSHQQQQAPIAGARPQGAAGDPVPVVTIHTPGAPRNQPPPPPPGSPELSAFGKRVSALDPEHATPDDFMQALRDARKLDVGSDPRAIDLWNEHLDTLLRTCVSAARREDRLGRGGVNAFRQSILAIVGAVPSPRRLGWAVDDLMAHVHDPAALAQMTNCFGACFEQMLKQDPDAPNPYLALIRRYIGVAPGAALEFPYEIEAAVKKWDAPDCTLHRALNLAELIDATLRLLSDSDSRKGLSAFAKRRSEYHALGGSVEPAKRALENLRRRGLEVPPALSDALYALSFTGERRDARDRGILQKWLEGVVSGAIAFDANRCDRALQVFQEGKAQGEPVFGAGREQVFRRLVINCGIQYPFAGERGKLHNAARQAVQARVLAEYSFLRTSDGIEKAGISSRVPQQLPSMQALEEAIGALNEDSPAQAFETVMQTIGLLPLNHSKPEPCLVRFRELCCRAFNRPAIDQARRRDLLNLFSRYMPLLGEKVAGPILAAQRGLVARTFLASGSRPQVDMVDMVDMVELSAWLKLFADSAQLVFHRNDVLQPIKDLCRTLVREPEFSPVAFAASEAALACAQAMDPPGGWRDSTDRWEATLCAVKLCGPGAPLNEAVWLRAVQFLLIEADHERGPTSFAAARTLLELPLQLNALALFWLLRTPSWQGWMKWDVDWAGFFNGLSPELQRKAGVMFFVSRNASKPWTSKEKLTPRSLDALSNAMDWLDFSHEVPSGQLTAAVQASGYPEVIARIISEYVRLSEEQRFSFLLDIMNGSGLQASPAAPGKPPGAS